MADANGVRDEITIQKNAVALIPEATWHQMVTGCRRVELQKGSILIARDGLSPDDIEDIIKAARPGETT